MNFSLHESEEAGFTVLHVTGEVDVYTAAALRERIADLLDGDRRLAVDLDGVEFLDSTGLGVLVAAVNRAREAGRDLVVVCSRPRLLKLFRLTGVEELLVVVGRLEDAPARPSVR